MSLESKRLRMRCLKGSFTIEASFIVPVIVLGIIALIWVVFYLRNSVKAAADADNFVFLLEADTALEKDAVRYEERTNVASKAYYGLEKAKAVIQRDGRKIRVDVDVEQALPEGGLLGSMVSRLRKIHVERDIKSPDPSETARIIKAAGEITGRIREMIGK